MSKHTPGPWGLHYSAGHGVEADIVGADDQKFKVGRLASVATIPETWGDSKANARLIAAAPELLKALKYAIRLYGATEMSNPDLEPLRAAVAKAEGNS